MEAEAEAGGSGTFSVEAEPEVVFRIFMEAEEAKVVFKSVVEVEIRNLREAEVGASIV